MELNKKTTILFTTKLQHRLKRVPEQRGVSIGELVRQVCVAQYGIAGAEQRRTAVKEMARLALPVADPQGMKRESVPDPDGLLP